MLTADRWDSLTWVDRQAGWVTEHNNKQVTLTSDQQLYFCLLGEWVHGSKRLFSKQVAGFASVVSVAVVRHAG